MSVKALCAAVLVICATMLQPTPPVLDPATNQDAYEIYARALEGLGTRRDTSLLVRQETDRGNFCPEFLGNQTGEWAEVASDFQHQNSVERLLLPALTVKIQYNFIRELEIVADAVVMASQGRRSEIEYASVSSVGFNHDRTKAIVSAHLTGGGAITKFELQDGVWQRVGTSCGWDY